ncbi:sensor histidine kinase [Brevibacillus thermoruber]|uniref:sensor histidine kinase n=1 Tax=Brevibacillus thermoruber TaxID=33942 RepID=UPI0005559A10|nr:HAMP domain-containing sensor histidine kinase [Brevibacillus thermoruber]
MKLLYRITLAFGLLLIVVTGVSAYLINSFLLENLIEQQRRELALKGQVWIEKVKASGETIKPEEIQELSRLVVSNRKVEILLLGRRKKVLYTTLPSASLDQWIDQLERKAKKRQDKNIWMIGSDDYIVVTLPLKNGENQRLLLATPVRGLKDMRMELTGNIMASLLLGAICAIILSFFITRSLVTPLSRLTEEIKKVQRRRFSEVEMIPASGEIAEVTKSVYFMAQELDRFHSSQKQFFQNASHELKTPLMSIQGYAEGIRDGVFTGESARQGLDVIVKETTRLKNIVTEMILLAKLESEEDLFHPSEVSVPELVHQAVERLHPLMMQNGVDIAVRCGAANPRINVDSEKFLQAVLNILGNAVRHAREHIEISIEEKNRHVLIAIIDDGEGIPDDLLPNLFHRFVKGKNGETGLGLAISRAIVERSGGTIEAGNGRTGAVFRIRMPLFHG